MDAIRLLEKLVSINSVFPNEYRLACFLEKELKRIGFKVRRQQLSKNRFNLLAKRGNYGKALLFYGHMDTVPAYGRWRTTPFKLVKRGDRLYGLGAWDMKAGIAAILKACELKTNRKIKIAFGVDEENVSAGAWAIAKSRFISDLDGVIVTEAGNSSGKHPGPRMLTLGRRGRAVYEISIPGLSAHGAVAIKGINAIDEAAKLITYLNRMKLRSHTVLPPANQFVRKIWGESSSLSVPDSATLEIDRHLVPPETPESVLSEIREYINSLYSSHVFHPIGGRRITVRLKKRKTAYLPPYVTPINSQFVKRMVAVVNQSIGKPIYNYALSVADENIFASKGLPVITIGPAGADDHSSKEWVSERSYLQLIDVLREIISNYKNHSIQR